jgi:hypothetical protein
MAKSAYHVTISNGESENQAAASAAYGEMAA